MKTDGGPAFPSEGTGMVGMHPHQFTNPGMTLRQWYAGMAMQGILSSDIPNEIREAQVVGWAWSMADAMLAQEADE